MAVLLSSALAVGCGVASRDQDGRIVEGGGVAAVELRLGDCFDDPADLPTEEVSEFVDVDAVPCQEPHHNEVFHTFELTDESLPSDEEIGARVDEECLPAFDRFVGIAYEDSELDLFEMWPTEGSWTEGDRTVICALFAMDGSKLEGSAEGIQR